MNNILITQSPYRYESRIDDKRNDSAGKTNKSLSDIIEINIHPYFLMIFLVFVAAFLSAVSLMHFNTVVTQGYQLKKLELVRQELQNEEDSQNMYLAKAKSMSSILENSRLDRMTKPSELFFVYNDVVIAKAR